MAEFKSGPNERRFFTAMAIATMVIVYLGFAHSYGSKIASATRPVPVIIKIHGLIFASWMLVFVGQCVFVLKRRMDWHRRLGALGMILAGIMLVSAFFTALAAAREGHRGIPGVEFATPAGFLLLNLSSAIIFVTLAVAGWAFRGRPPIHKRLMLMATVAGLAPPGISRLPLLSGHTPAIAAVTLLFILIGPIYDWRTHGRPHKAYLWSLPLVALILPPVVAALSASDLWQNIAARLMS